MSAARRCSVAVLVMVFLVAVMDLPLYAQQASSSADYRVGVGDRLYLSVDQRPDLNRELVVEEGGVVKLPVIGEVVVVGLTVQEIEKKLLDALRDYYPSVTKIRLTIREAVSQLIYINGQVGNPGKYNFHKSPSLWEAIREAGGPTPTASLDNVRVVKDRAKGGQSKVYNVLNALETGTLDQLPDLEAGDTVIVPTIAEVYTGSFGVNVYGAVVKPGIYKLQSRQDLVSAVLTAGGSTQLAALERVNIIRSNTDGSISTTTVDFRSYLELGDPLGNPMLKPGDTVHVPTKGRLKQLTEADLTVVLGILTTTLSAVALIYAIQDDKQNN